MSIFFHIVNLSSICSFLPFTHIFHTVDVSVVWLSHNKIAKEFSAESAKCNGETLHLLKVMNKQYIANSYVAENLLK